MLEALEAGNKLVPTGDDEAAHLRAREFVDSAETRDEIGKVLRLPNQSESWRNTYGITIECDPDIDPCSTALYAALTTDTLEEQVALAGELDELVNDVERHPHVPVIGTSIKEDSWGHTHSFMGLVTSPKVDISLYGYAEINLPIVAEWLERDPLFVVAVHREAGNIDVFSLAPHEPVLYYSGARFNFRRWFEDEARDHIFRSEAPFISVARLADPDRDYNPRYHSLFRYMSTMYIGQIAKQPGNEDLRVFAETAEAERQRMMRQPFDQETQVREAQMVLNFISRHGTPAPSTPQ